MLRTLALALLVAPCVAQQPLEVATVEHDAPSVARKMKYNIVVPRDYGKSEQRYPVLYLLHGLTSNYTAWARMRVPEYAADHDLIVVMPDVGNSWYVNWSKSENGQKNDWEDYIIEDLIGHVDANYRTIVARHGRAINGLSMGGYGGIMLGLRHPDMFCAIGSHSGALSFARGVRGRIGQEGGMRRRRPPSERVDPRIGIEGFSSQKQRSPNGTMFATVEECDAYDPFELVTKVDREMLPHIYIDCGTEDRLIRSSRDFAELLREQTIPFTYAESGGGHRAPYWAREVEHSMAVQMSIIKRAMRAAEQK